MRLAKIETFSKGVRLGLLAALMVIHGYRGEVPSDAGVRWLWWALAMIPFIWIVYVVLVEWAEVRPEKSTLYPNLDAFLANPQGSFNLKYGQRNHPRNPRAQS